MKLGQGGWKKSHPWEEMLKEEIYDEEVWNSVDLRGDVIGLEYAASASPDAFGTACPTGFIFLNTCVCVSACHCKWSNDLPTAAEWPPNGQDKELQRHAPVLGEDSSPARRCNHHKWIVPTHHSSMFMHGIQVTHLFLSSALIIEMVSILWLLCLTWFIGFVLFHICMFPTVPRVCTYFHMFPLFP